jgi:O-antigen/teichoic acid export membrane protein
MIKKIIAQYSKQAKPVKAAFWFTVCNFMPRGIQFFVIPIYIRVLTVEQYGMYAVYQSWVYVLSIFATLNLSAGVFDNGMHKYENDRDRYMSSLQGLSTVVTLVLFLVFLFLKKWIVSLFNLPFLLIILMFIYCLFSPAWNFWNGRQRFEYNYGPLILFTALMSILAPAFGLTFIQLTEFKGEAIIVGTVSAGLIFFIFFYIRNFICGKQFFNGRYWKMALCFNLPLIPHYLSGVILGQSDRVMIDRLIGRGEAGIYNLAYQIALVMSLIIHGVNAALVPWTYKSIKAERYNEIRNIVNWLIFLFASVSLLIVLIAPEIIGLIATDAYLKAIPVIPPVVIGVFFTFIYGTFVILEFYFEENKFIMIASSIAAIVNIALNFLFIPHYGYLAAAYTTLFCYAVLAVSHYIFMRIVCHKHIDAVKIHNGFFILLVSLGLIIFSAILMLLYNERIIRYIILLLAIAISVIKRRELIGAIRIIKGS